MLGNRPQQPKVNCSRTENNFCKLPTESMPSFNPIMVHNYFVLILFDCINLSYIICTCIAFWFYLNSHFSWLVKLWHNMPVKNKSAAGMHDTPPHKFDLVQMHNINLQYQTTSSRYELLNKV